MRLGELRPGDLVELMEVQSILIARVDPHPLYPGLSLFIWRITEDGSISLDALDPRMEMMAGTKLHSGNHIREGIHFNAL